MARGDPKEAAVTIYTNLADAPEKHYGLILLDPAWRFKTYAPQNGQKGNRSADKHYPTMTIEEMMALPVRRVAARDCYMIMWTSWPHLESALRLMKAYGFTYKSSFCVWFKMKRGFSPSRVFLTLPNDMHKGSGYSTRKNTEMAILGTRGSPRRQAKDVWEPIFAPVREHSRKPDQQYGMIERFAVGPFLEMNARTERPGWDQWGNEVEKFVHPVRELALPVQLEPEQMQMFGPPKLRFTVKPGPDPVDTSDAAIPAFLTRLAGG